MPDACPSGSEAAPGAPETFYLGAALINSVLPTWGDWLGQLIPLIGQTLVTTATFCSSSPDSADEITVADVAEALLTPLGMINLADKVRAAALLQAWNTYCVCLPSVGPVVETVIFSSECPPPDTDIGYSVDSTIPAWQILAKMTSSDADLKGAWVLALGTLLGTTVVNTGGVRLNGAEGEVEILSYTGHVDHWELFHSAGDGGHACCSYMKVNTVRPAGTVVTPVFPDPQDKPDGLPDSPEPPTCADLDAVCAAIAALSQQISIVNAGAGPTNALIESINQVTPARTLAPEGSASGQTGDSTHAVSDIRAVTVHVTTIPAYKGHAWSAPYTWYDLGVVRLQAGSDWSYDYPIDREYFILWDVSPLVTSIGLSLAPGVEATVSWLTKET